MVPDISHIGDVLEVADIEKLASCSMTAEVHAYIADGAGAGRTIAANRRALEDVWLLPQIPATRCDDVNTSVEIFGRTLAFPVLLAPTSPQRLVHEDAELASAAAAVQVGSIPIISMDSHYPLPRIVEASGGAGWFQLYPYRSLDDVAASVDYAERAGSSAIVVTIDCTYVARRLSIVRTGFRTPSSVDFDTLRRLGILRGEIPANGRLERLALTWDDITWLRSLTKLPLVVKGILRSDDAQRCIDLGADGIVVSNHGGRQLDGAVPSIVALRSIARQVGDQCLVLMDGGIRSGSDVFKALALGAHAVCIGRPYLWGLKVAGQAGVVSVLDLLREELQDVMRQAGAALVGDIALDSVCGLSGNPL